MEKSSGYDEILGAFERSDSIGSQQPITNEDDTPPEPMYMALDDQCEQIVSEILDANAIPPPLPSDPHTLVAVTTNQSVDLGITNISSNQELYDKFIGDNPPIEQPSQTVY